MKFRSKLVEIEAIQYLGDESMDALRAFVPHEWRGNRMHQPLGIITPEGVMEIRPTDWIIKGTEGEFYPCKDSVFQRKYEPIISLEDVRQMTPEELAAPCLPPDCKLKLVATTKDQP